ncbi:MAG: carbon-nitrogen hydrolase family protein [Acidimicrobiales bacterium]
MTETNGVVTVAAVQLSSGSDPVSNVATAIELIREAASRGAIYIQVPEYFNYLGPARNFPAVSETVPGPTTARLGQLARELNVTVHVGSLLERSSDPAKCFNTSVVLGSDGLVKALYRKVHLFDIAVPDQIVHQESDDIAAGSDVVVVGLAGFRLGLSICFDVRFAELYRALALGGAQVFSIPAAFNASTGRAHWEVLVRARAIENLAYVVAAAQVGTTIEGIATYGHSMIVGPWGQVLGESTSTGPEVLVATIDVGEVARRRSQIAALELRRPDVYVTPVSDGTPGDN